MDGRLLLVKEVIQSMMVHCISVYNWPVALIKQISTWMRNFIWSGNLDRKILVIVAWENCGKGVKKEGLGLKSISSFNAATNLHLCWNFV